MTDFYDTVQKLVRHELRMRRFAEMGQVQAVYPGASGDKGNYDADVVLHATDLVLRHVPVLTPRKGWASLPEVGDLVLVQFMGGDVNRPVVVGTLYNGDDRPPTNAEGDWAFQLPASADDESSAVRVTVQHADPLGFRVQMKGDRFDLQVQDDDPVATLKVAGTTLTIDGSGNVTLEGAADVTVKAGGNLTLEAGGNGEFKASGTLALKGAKIDLN